MLGSVRLTTGIKLPVHRPPEDGERKMSKSEMKCLKKKQAQGKIDSNGPVEQTVIGAVDYNKDLSGRRVNRTVSGQLNVRHTPVPCRTPKCQSFVPRIATTNDDLLPGILADV